MPAMPLQRTPVRARPPGKRHLPGAHCTRATQRTQHTGAVAAGFVVVAVCVLFADFDATTRLHYTLAARQEPTTNQPLNQLFTTWINATGTGGALVNATVVE